MRAPWSIEAEDALLAATERWIAAMDRWLGRGEPASPEESKAIYDAAVAAVRRIRAVLTPLPCPHCGGQAEVTGDEEDGDSWVFCRDCSLQGLLADTPVDWAPPAGASGGSTAPTATTRAGIGSQGCLPSRLGAAGRGEK